MTRVHGSEHISCPCGSRWFRLESKDGPGCVAFEPDGAVSAYTGLPVCVECGRAMPEASLEEPERTLEASWGHHLRLVEDEQ